jgi:hypothetical protein
MHDAIGWALGTMAMAAATSAPPQPGLSRPRIVVERSATGECRADDASDGGSLEVEVTVRNEGGAATAHLVAWPLSAPGTIGPPAPAAFGAIEPGAVATRAVRFAGYGACRSGRPQGVTVGLMDRGVWLGALDVTLRPEQDGRD